MQYKFVEARENYEAFASGGVLYALPGHPAFPVRLANEIFQRCMAFRETEGEAGPCRLYDPCCGGAYHLTTLAYFNWERIERIFASDIDREAVGLAARNLALLSVDGMERRIKELESMVQRFGKESHAEALKHAMMLRQRLGELSEDHRIETHLFRADATKRTVVAGLGSVNVDLVITDIPYGQHSQWQAGDATTSPAAQPVERFLGSLLGGLSAKAIVAVAASKGDKITHEGYQQLKRLKVGKRQVVFLRPRLMP
jgi:hypothetical protein